MAETFGYGDFQYTFVADWLKLPDGMRLMECPGVVCDSQDRVFILTRGEHPIMVFDPDGNFIRSFGQGLFSDRTHGLYIAHDDSILAADDGIHTIQKFTPDGEKVMEIGERNHPAPKWSGQPFNRPTSAAIRPANGDIYISDGYGNSRIHVYSGNGDYKFSWGEPGIDAGQFIRPHNIAIDEDGLIYVADRECHRVQVFSESGTFVAMWNNIHRPDGLTLAPDGNIYIGELNAIPGLDGAPNLGHRVSVYDRSGNRLALIGHPDEGEHDGKFIAPHGIAVDGRGDVYVGEVSNTIAGARLGREPRSLKKLVRRP